MTGAWHDDVLGPGFEARALALPGDAEATLVRYTPDPPPATPPRVAVLYVHGFVDYFFHPHVARAFADRGYAFYAVDLRGYGRSLDTYTAAGFDPNSVTDLAVYAQDLDVAAAEIRAAGHEQLVLLGHSTGGLVGPLWAAAKPGRADALILNSPWLDLNKPWFHRVITTRLLDVVGGVAPRLVVGRIQPHYGRALHRATGGEWDFDLAWKPHEGFPARAGWSRSVRRGHARVARGLGLTVPVLVLASDRTGSAARWHEELMTTDSVLDVAHIRDRAPRLGDDVTYVEVPGGAHDLALSPAPARDTYLSAALDWLEDRLPPK